MTTDTITADLLAAAICDLQRVACTLHQTASLLAGVAEKLAVTAGSDERVGRWPSCVALESKWKEEALYWKGQLKRPPVET